MFTGMCIYCSINKLSVGPVAVAADTLHFNRHITQVNYSCSLRQTLQLVAKYLTWEAPAKTRNILCETAGRKSGTQTGLSLSIPVFY